MAVAFTRNRITGGTEFLMGAAAWTVYGINFLVNIIGDWFGVGEVISFIFMALAYCGFAFWFATKGVNVLGSKIVSAIGGMILLSVIPIVNVFTFSRGKDGLPRPTVRAVVSKVIEIVKQEDDEYNKKQAAKAINNDVRKQPPPLPPGNSRKGPPPLPQEESRKAA